MSTPSYNQPEKQKVRESVLSAAVEALTSRREKSPLVLPDELGQVLEFAVKAIGDRALVPGVLEEFEKWEHAYGAKVGVKRPADLKVLYLCGPEPLNDLSILTSFGVNPHNVWAVESSEKEFSQAITQVAESGVPVKVHHGNLAEFFDLYPESFDLVYYDACGALPAGSPNTLDPILKLFAGARLEPLSVLITNFSEVPPEKNDRFARLMSSYFRFRYNDLPREFWSSDLDPAECEADDMELVSFIAANPMPFYSEFVTRLITDLARYWIPNCRALCMRAVSENFLASKAKVKAVLESALNTPQTAPTLNEWMRSVGDMVVSPGSYPVFSFFRSLKSGTEPDPLAHQLENFKIAGHDTKDMVAFASMLDKIVEGHWDCLSGHMLAAIRQSWFDAAAPFSCDGPLPNLLINSLLGMYGRPYFPNTRSSLRYSYRAKATTMFTDCLVLDQCRYFFDWFPTVRMVPERFKSKPFQVMARCILDRLGWFDHGSESHPFRYSAVPCQGEVPAAKPSRYPSRLRVGESSPEST